MFYLYKVVMLPEIVMSEDEQGNPIENTVMVAGNDKVLIETSETLEPLQAMIDADESGDTFSVESVEGNYSTVLF
jgi:hypothetical protein